MKVRKNDVDGDFFFLRGRERLRCVRSKIEDVAGFQEGDYARKRHEPTPGGDVLRNQVTCFPHRAPCGIAPALLQTWASYFFTFCTGRRLTVCSLPNAVSKLSFYRFVSTPNPSPPYANALDASPPPRNTPRLVHPPPASPRPTGRARRTQSRLPRRLNPRTRQSSSIAASTASQTRRE